MKRLLAGFVLVAAMLSTVPDAEALRRTSICYTEYGDGGEVCYQDCSYYDEYGNRTGRVIVDYHC